MTKIGIIGHGSFGKLAAKALSSHGEVLIHDSRPLSDIPAGTVASLKEVASVDSLILAIPLDAHRPVLKSLKTFLRPETLLIDICSVKTKSHEILTEELANHPNILSCHPLFGPDSAREGIEGHQVVITNVTGDRAKQAVDFCKNTLKLKIITTSAKEHDHVMAQTHVLTSFVARGIANLGIDINSMPFEPPSFRVIRQLIDINERHSDHLFKTIQLGNPSATDIRHKLINSLSDIDDEISKEL